MSMGQKEIVIFVLLIFAPCGSFPWLSPVPNNCLDSKMLWLTTGIRRKICQDNSCFRSAPALCRLELSALDSGLVGSSKHDLAKFLGIESSAPERTFEDACKENEREHSQECAGPPWNQFRRFVSYKERDSREVQWDPVAFYRNLIGPSNAPFNTENLLCVSKQPLLSRDECDAIIREAEEIAATPVGWDSRYTYGASAREIHVEALPTTFKMLGGDLLPRRLLPAIERAFPSCIEMRAVHLRVYSALVIKYDPAGGRSSMPAHQDFSFVTLNIVLNDENDYVGGGTDVRALGRAIRIPRGHGLAHAGALWHSGRAVSQGVRYVLAIFLHSRPYVEHGSRFLQRAARLRAAGRLEEASAECAYAVRAAPGDQEAWLQSGLIYTQQEDWAAAERCFLKALGLHPAGLAAVASEITEAPSNSIPCKLQADGHSVPPAGADLDSGPAGPVPAELLYNLGAVWLRLGRPGSALRALEAAAAADPTCERTQRSLERVRAAMSTAQQKPSGAT